MSIVAVENTPARGARNGLTWKPYRYQGSGVDVLTPWMDDDDCYCAGTSYSYVVHLQYGEMTCAPSRAAHAAKLARSRQRRKQVTP